MAKIVVKQKAEVKQEFILPADNNSVLIGTEADNDLIIQDKRVSMNHLELIRSGNGWQVKDLRSAFGTFLNHVSINKLTELKNGDQLDIGNTSLFFYCEKIIPTTNELNQTETTIVTDGTKADETAYQSRVAPTKKPQPLNYYLTAIHGPYRGKKFQLNSTETKIGRDTKLNDIVIRLNVAGKVDSSISRRHATIIHQNGQFSLTDKRSKTRTFVNQKKVAEDKAMLVKPDDEIEIVSDLKSTIFRLCPVEKLNFAPPRKSGVWWVRYKKPGQQIIAAMLMIVALVVFTRSFFHRYLLTSSPDTLSFKSQLWAEMPTAQVDFDLEPLIRPENLNNTPALSDLNGDGYLDAVLYDLEGKIRTIDGKNRKSIWPENPITQKLRVQQPGQLVLCDINQDQVPDILALSKSERLVAIDGRMGVEIWHSPILGGRFDGPPALADYNADGRMDVAAVKAEGQLVIGFGSRTEPFWQFVNLADSLKSPAAAGDVTGDGVADILLGSETGYVLVFNGISNKFVWRNNVNTLIDSINPGQGLANAIHCPVCPGKLNDDAASDLVISTNLGNVLAIDAATKKPIWLDSSPLKSNLLTELYLPAALGDLDGDGLDDTVFFTLDGTIRAIKGGRLPDTGKVVLWEFPPETWEKYLGNPSLADWNKDGALDVVAAGANYGLTIIDGRSGELMWRSNFKGENPPQSTPVIGDLDRDSFLDILLVRSDQKLYQFSSNVRYPVGSVVWGQRFGDSGNSSHATVIDLSVSYYNILILLSLILAGGVVLWGVWHFKTSQNYIETIERSPKAEKA